MYFGGIDVGSLTAQAVIIKNGAICSYHSIRVKPNPVDSAKTVLEAALAQKGMQRNDLTFTVSTGYGREQIQKEGLSQENMSEISCHGKGAHSILPQVRTIIDIGGQDAKVIRVDSGGELMNFVMNDKCAAGTGRFLEVMSKTLGVTIEELGP
ncbi:MAG TPA: acyl-CoA dehydratase activase, partial [Bacillota bacterium]|nr:acyl-CoA dehydratase activase [Bacillota bacterium]